MTKNIRVSLGMQAGENLTMQGILIASAQLQYYYVNL